MELCTSLTINSLNNNLQSYKSMLCHKLKNERKIIDPFILVFLLLKLNQKARGGERVRKLIATALGHENRFLFFFFINHPSALGRPRLHFPHNDVFFSCKVIY